jgi:hypothetical protein
MVEALGVAGTVVAVLAGLAGLAVIVGVLIARARNSADETTLAVWKGEAEAQKARADRLDAAVAALTARVDKVEHENTLLKELVTGRQEIAELGRIVEARFTRLEALLTPSPVQGGGATVNVGGN